ncbi:DNA-binding transcriptional MerR regulator [Lachnospiraceae bacterium PM6-15]|uniref:hypothetical protein n=1 Tax=Ohessyouella blattaphilus TaxID=2949333 RepID=UPI003E1DCC84
MMDDKKKKERKENILNAGIAGAAAEKIQRYGSAAKQHYVAYYGIDNEGGKKLAKGLKQLSEQKINPDYKYQNIHQQAGFSAEVKDAARFNADNIIKGDSGKKIRTDDIGSVNDPIYDAFEIDAKGNIVDGSGTQMKFLGASEKDPTGEGASERALQKLQSKKFDKYWDNDAKIEVPSNQYDEIISEANSKIEKLTRQLKNQKGVGNEEQNQKIQDKIDKLEKIKRNLRRSTVSSDEAVFARLHPKLSTAVDVAKISHEAGIKTAESAAIIGGSVSIARNLVSVCKGEMELEDAIKNVAKDTTTTAACGYGTGFAGTAIKGAMQNSGSQYMQTLSKTNIAGTVVAVTVATTKTLNRYFQGDIDGVECLESLGEQGTGMISSAMFSVIGQAVIPVPVVGGLIGGMVGYAVSSATYGVLMKSLKEEKLARETRIQIEQACEEHIRLIRLHRAEMEKIINEYLAESIEVFRESFSGIKSALAIGDVDWFIEGSNKITKSFGGTVAFSSMGEFEQMMTNEETFKL